MIVLRSTQTLQIVLAGAATPAPQITVVFRDTNKEGVETKWDSQESTANGATDVDICSAPPTGFTRNIYSVMMCNNDNAAVVTTIKKDQSGTETNLITAKSIATLLTLGYEHLSGWYVV